MRAQTLNFEKNKDPKKSLKIGKNRWKSISEYVNEKLQEKNLNSEDFWNEWNNMMEELYDKSDLLEFIHNILDNTSIDYQIDFIKNDLEEYIKNYYE